MIAPTSYRTLSLAAACALALIASACSTTQQVGLKQSEVKCGFLGGDCSHLEPGPNASLRWLNPKAKWTEYNQVLIEPVTFWGGETSSVSAADQQSLTNFFYQALQTQIGQKFPLATAPGPGVMRVQAAITDLEAATPVLRTISMVVPQARILATLKYAATGTYAFVGGAQVEGKITDSVTGMVLAEAVDRRVGGGSIETAAQWKWGDAENGLTKMATLVAERLKAWTSGAQSPN